MRIITYVEAASGQEEALNYQIKPRRSPQLPVGVDNEALFEDVVDDAATRPFLVFRPDGYCWKPLSAQLSGAQRSERSPMLMMAAMRQEFAVGLSLARWYEIDQ
ncbi:hypothetical protein ACFQY5_40970 [Paeniroseomonas aquatica]|uniref:Uncharacterized protein n=1 Tax=Paeniroseomonas aquatica TaxID=373043 RepID=A0ABT8AG20_9PROT|nr:hypothetical protein [Paeniroseomonas aquatica]MDN3568764.1 hypothetical protein [Paeniroseomonas aquatica]